MSVNTNHTIFYSCDNCDYYPLTGFRWHCDSCDDFDMCQSCYEIGDTHDKTHPFKQIEIARSPASKTFKDVIAENEKVEDVVGLLLARHDVTVRDSKRLTYHKSREILEYYRLAKQYLDSQSESVEKTTGYCLIVSALLLAEVPPTKLVPPGLDVTEASAFQLCRHLAHVLTALVIQVQARDKFNWFCAPVERSVPNYYTVITKPMDLGTVQKRLRNYYITNAERAIQSETASPGMKAVDVLFKLVADDIKLVWDNALKFNSVKNALYPFALKSRNTLNTLLTLVLRAFQLSDTLLSDYMLWDDKRAQKSTPIPAPAQSRTVGRKRKGVSPTNSPVNRPTVAKKKQAAKEIEAATTPAFDLIEPVSVAQKNDNITKRNTGVMATEVLDGETQREIKLREEMVRLKTEIYRLNAKVDTLANIIGNGMKNLSANFKSLSG